MKATQMSQNSLSQPGMMRIAMGTPKPGEQVGVGEEDPHHRHSLGKVTREEGVTVVLSPDQFSPGEEKTELGPWAGRHSGPLGVTNTCYYPKNS